MQASQKRRIKESLDQFYDHVELFHCSDDSRRTTNVSLQNSDLNCTRESSPNQNYLVRSSSSPRTISPDRSPTLLSESQSNPHEDSRCEDDFTIKVRELETLMLGSNTDSSVPDISVLLAPQLTEMVYKRDLKEMLCSCAEAMEEKDMDRVEWLVSELRSMVSVTGEPIQRLGAYMLEGIVARMASSGSSIYKSLSCKDPVGPELLSYMHVLYEVCPYFKFGYLSANGAIADAMKGETQIHIIDFQISQGSQWISLIQALASQPGGPPKVRITGIDDVTSAFARGGGLEIVRQRLSRLANFYEVPFEFYAVKIPAQEIGIGHLEIRPGEAVAVNFPLMLHHIPDESVCPENHRDRLIRLLNVNKRYYGAVFVSHKVVKCRLSKSLSPRVVTLVEQESNTNTAPFHSRFVETLNYYLAVFESIEVTLPRNHKERVSVEQHCLARDIVNLIACEGMDRVERHEPLGKWRSRFMMAGFNPYPLSTFVNATIKGLLGSYSEKYTLEEKDDSLLLGWMNRPLVSSCAWKVRNCRGS